MGIGNKDNTIGSGNTSPKWPKVCEGTSKQGEKALSKTKQGAGAAPRVHGANAKSNGAGRSKRRGGVPPGFHYLDAYNNLVERHLFNQQGGAFGAPRGAGLLPTPLTLLHPAFGATPPLLDLPNSNNFPGANDVNVASHFPGANGVNGANGENAKAPNGANGPNGVNGANGANDENGWNHHNNVYININVNNANGSPKPAQAANGNATGNATGNNQQRPNITSPLFVDTNPGVASAPFPTPSSSGASSMASKASDMSMNIIFDPILLRKLKTLKNHRESVRLQAQVAIVKESVIRRMRGDEIDLGLFTTPPPPPGVAVVQMQEAWTPDMLLEDEKKASIYQ